MILRLPRGWCLRDDGGEGGLRGLRAGGLIGRSGTSPWRWLVLSFLSKPVGKDTPWQPDRPVEQDSGQA